jgi:hypothetical protein
MSGRHEIDLGPCCCCGGTEDVRNLVSLPRKALVPGTGWGCVVCHLPGDGAIYVACDRCIEEHRPPFLVCNGYPVKKGRASIAELSDEVFEHDLTFHPEARER